MPTSAVAQTPGTNRYAVALAALGAALLSLVVLGSVVTSFLWPEAGTATPSTHIYLGNVEKYPIGTPTYVAQDGATFWLVRPDDRTLLALYSKDGVSHCTLPWRPDYSFTDPRTGDNTKGWFKDICHGDSIYDVRGQRVAGWATRDMDRYEAKLDHGKIVVSTQLIRGEERR